MPRRQNSGARIPHSRGGGSASKYRQGCRCADCRAAWAEYARLRRERKREGLVRGVAAGVTHGTTSAYTEGCRCEKCRTAIANYWKGFREEDRSRMPHGAPRYSKGCRCSICREAVRVREKERRSAKRAHSQTMPDEKHGTKAGYDYWRCRCDECRRAYAEYRRGLG